MPLHERWAVLVEICSDRGDFIFGISAVGILTTAMENGRPAMNLFHSLQQKLDNFRMQVATNQSSQ
jgi:hypothetical protein